MFLFIKSKFIRASYIVHNSFKSQVNKGLIEKKLNVFTIKSLIFKCIYTFLQTFKFYGVAVLFALEYFAYNILQ